MPVLMYHPNYASDLRGSKDHPIEFADSAAPHWEREGGWLRIDEAPADEAKPKKKAKEKETD